MTDNVNDRLQALTDMMGCLVTHSTHLDNVGKRILSQSEGLKIESLLGTVKHKTLVDLAETWNEGGEAFKDCFTDITNILDTYRELFSAVVEKIDKELEGA